MQKPNLDGEGLRPTPRSYQAYCAVSHDERVQRVIRDVLDEQRLQTANELSDQFLDCGTLRLVEELELSVVDD